jgi:ubiquitin-protein ligase
MSHEPWSELWELRMMNKNLEIIIALLGNKSPDDPRINEQTAILKKSSEALKQEVDKNKP